MPAVMVTTWDVQLYWRRRREGKHTLTLNADDDDMLRGTLEQLVGQRMGKGWRGDLSEWSIEVTHPRNGRRQATVTIDQAGRTEVKR
jgi:hypothetical protein